MTSSIKKIFVIAGEASGDLHGASLIRALQTQSREPLEIYGVGGEKIRQTGAKEFYDLAHFHVTGFTEALLKIPQYKKAAAAILGSIRKVRPDLVVLIDNPGFNLHLAQKIHALGIRIVYYIAPQLWAWAPKRILKIKKTVAKVLVVFEFEKKIYEDHGIPVAFIGHPLKDLIEGKKSKFEGKKSQIVLLPGSRKGEVRTLLPIFLRASQIIRQSLPALQFILVQSSTLKDSFYEKILKQSPGGMEIVRKNGYEAMESSQLAIACSGTATLECALLETPMIICNRAGILTYLLAKKLIRVPYLGLPNLILGEEKFPELLQYDATPEKIAKKAVEILTDENLKKAAQNALKEVSSKLGSPGANLHAAEEILKIL